VNALFDVVGEPAPLNMIEDGKALTVCQPYAWLISLPESDPRHKRIENRNWFTSYRGRLLIHAGKSKKWLDTWGDLTPGEASSLIYGAIVAVCDLIDCIEAEYLKSAMHLPKTLLPFRLSRHLEGPWCWLLANVKPIRPIYCSGAMGLWDSRIREIRNPQSEIHNGKGRP
jgi:hypothetical protein